jgi:hypothetical protein
VDVEALNLTSPFLVIHAEGDRTTLRAWSDRLVNSVLMPAGKDVTYETPLYESLGYPNPGTGVNAHSLTAEPSRYDATARINSWATGKVPLYTEVSGAVDMGTIQALPDFSPALQPTPTNP